MKINMIFRRIIINTSSQIVAKIATVILGFLMVGLLTRYLGVAQYGIYNLVFAYLTFFSIFADFGLQLTLVRDVSGKSESSKNLKSIYFSLKIIFTIISTLLSLIVLLFFPYSPTIKMAIFIGSLAVGVGQMNAYGASVLQAEIKLNLVALLDVINRIVTVLAIFVVMHLELGLNAIVLSVLVGNAVSMIVNISLAPSYFHVNSIPSFDVMKKIITASFPIGIASLLATLYFKVDTLLLSVMKSTIDVGIYSFSYKLFENIIVLWGFYMASVYPLLAGSIKNKTKFNTLLRNSFFVSMAFSLLVVVVGYAFAPFIVKVFAGNEFTNSIHSLRILLFTVPFLCINNIIYYYFLIHKKISVIIFGLSISLLLNFALNLFFIPRYGYIASSYITVLSELTLCAILGFAYFSKNKRTTIDAGKD